MSNDFEIPNKPSIKPGPAKKGPSAPAAVVAEVPETAETPVRKEEAAPTYDPNELLRIFDEIIFNGEYVEEVIIRKRIPVRFSTRTAKQIGQVQDAIDGAGLTLISSIEQRRSILNLEHALVGFNGTDLSGLKKEERSAFIGNLAGPVIAMLLDAMSTFDMKIAAACREEANF